MCVGSVGRPSKAHLDCAITSATTQVSVPMLVESVGRPSSARPCYVSTNGFTQGCVLSPAPPVVWHSSGPLITSIIYVNTLVNAPTPARTVEKPLRTPHASGGTSSCTLVSVLLPARHAVRPSPRHPTFGSISECTLVKGPIVVGTVARPSPTLPTWHCTDAPIHGSDPFNAQFAQSRLSWLLICSATCVPTTVARPPVVQQLPHHLPPRRCKSCPTYKPL